MSELNLNSTTTTNTTNESTSNNISDLDRQFLLESIKLADSSRSNGNHPFGAILTNSSSEIILTAENSVNSESDCTRHAELNLISKFSKLNIPIEKYKEFTLYCSTEPCPMCCGAIYWSGISRVFFSCSAMRLNELAGGGFNESTKANILLNSGSRKIEVYGPIMEDKSDLVHQQYWKLGK